MSRADARLNNPTSRSVRLVTPESTGPGAALRRRLLVRPGRRRRLGVRRRTTPTRTRWPEASRTSATTTRSTCAWPGRILADWEGDGESGSFEFGAGDVVHWPAGFTIRNRVISDEPAHVFWVMGPAPEWMMPLTDPRPTEPPGPT